MGTKASKVIVVDTVLHEHAFQFVNRWGHTPSPYRVVIFKLGTHNLQLGNGPFMLRVIEKGSHFDLYSNEEGLLMPAFTDIGRSQCWEDLECWIELYGLKQY